MAQSNSGIGNVIPNNRVGADCNILCAQPYALRGRLPRRGRCTRRRGAQRRRLTKACQANVDALHRLLRALASALQRKRH
jgi:hypothetical protein